MYSFATFDGRNYKVYERKNGTHFVILNGKRQSVEEQFVMVSDSKPCSSNKERTNNGKCYKKCKAPLERSATTFKCEKKPKISYFDKQSRLVDNNELFEARIPRGNRVMVIRDIYVELNKNNRIVLDQLANVVGLTVSKNGKRMKKKELTDELKKYIRFNE